MRSLTIACPTAASRSHESLYGTRATAFVSAISPGGFGANFHCGKTAHIAPETHRGPSLSFSHHRLRRYGRFSDLSHAVSCAGASAQTKTLEAESPSPDRDVTVWALFEVVWDSIQASLLSWSDTHILSWTCFFDLAASRLPAGLTTSDEVRSMC